MFAEQALAESEKRFRALVTASSDVVYRMSADFGELRQLEGRLFVAASPTPNRNWFEEYIHPDDREQAREAIHDAISRKSMFEFECRVFLADGSVGWTHTRAVPMLDASGEITEWIGMVTNVTARKRAEQRTRQPAAHVRSHSHQHARPRLRLESASTASSTRTKACCACGAARWEEAIGKNCLELGYEPWHAAMHDREIEQIIATQAAGARRGAVQRRFRPALL